MSRLIEGRPVAEKVYAELRGEIAQLKKSGRTPGLAVVLVGDHPASRAYVRSKDKMCRDLGLHSVKLELPADTTQTELLQRVHELNGDPAIHGILVQSPPPKQIDEAAIVRALDPAKDVRGNVEDGVSEIRALLDRFNELSMNYSDETADEFSRVQEQIDAVDGWNLDTMRPVLFRARPSAASACSSRAAPKSPARTS